MFLITTLCGLIVLAGWGSDSILQSFFYEFDYSSAHPVLYAMGMLAAALAVLVPSVAAVTGCIRGLKGNGRVTTSSIVTIAAVEIVLIIIAIVCVTASNVYHPISLVSTTNMLPLTSSMATCLCSMNIF